MYIEEGAEREELTAALHSEGYSPVYLDQKTCDLHYNGFCNSVLWQLFHYVPLNIGACTPCWRPVGAPQPCHPESPRAPEGAWAPSSRRAWLRAVAQAAHPFMHTAAPLHCRQQAQRDAHAAVPVGRAPAG